MEEQNLYTWSDLPHLDQSMVDHINNSMNFQKVTKVQKAVIPLFLSNKDVCVKACTGSGKTLAFAVPLIQSFLKNKSTLKLHKSDVYALVLAPSRELAVQIYQVLEQFKPLIGEDISMTYFIGGTQLQHDLQRIKERGCNIVVGTVGRIFDLFQKNAFNLKGVEMFIMDEADKLLEIGFETQLNHIFQVLPKQRRTGLFSATMTSQLKNLIKLGMRNPFFVEVRVEDQGIFAIKGKEQESHVLVKQFDVAMMDKDGFQKQIKQISEIPSNLQNYYLSVEHQADKLPALLNFLKTQKPSRIFIFFGTCASVDFHNLILKKILADENVALYKLHGKIDQKKRAKIYNEFKTQESAVNNRHQLLLTTDLAARGIDIPDVDWILQFDPPQDSDQFVHRIGRTARAGRSGKSLIMLMRQEEAYVDFLRQKQVRMEEYTVPLEIENRAEIGELRKIVQEQMMKVDRDVIDKASSAFVSFVRYYKEHALQFIFAMNTLDIGQVANSFYLFKVPRVKEILGKPIKGFNGDNSVNVESIPYIDKNKANQKQGTIQKRQEKLKWKEEQKEYKEQKEKEQSKIRSVSQKKRKKKENDWNEWEDLKREENLYKKLKKGKLSEKEYNKLVYDSDFDEDL